MHFDPEVIAGGQSAEKLLAEFTGTNFFRIGLSYFGPGHERVSDYTQLTEDHDGKITAVLGFTVDYKSVTGKKYAETLVVYMSEQKGSYQLGKPHIYAIAQSLEKIQKTFVTSPPVLNGFVLTCIPARIGLPRRNRYGLEESRTETSVMPNKAFNPTVPPPAGPRVNLGVWSARSAGATAYRTGDAHG